MKVSNKARVYNRFITFFRNRGLMVAIIFVGVVTILSAVLNFIVRRESHHYNEVINQIRDVRFRNAEVIRFVNIADMGLRGYILVPSEQFLGPYKQAREQYADNIDSLNQLVVKQGFTRESIYPVKTAIKNYFDLINKMVMLRKNGQVKEVMKILQSDPGYNVWIKYKNYSDQLMEFEDKLQAETLERYEAYMRLSWYSQLILIVLGIPTLLLMVYRIYRSQRFRNRLFNKLAESNRTYIFDRGTNITANSHEQIINNMVNNIKYANKFISSVASGNLNNQWDGLNEENVDLNNDNLAGELMRMQAMLKEYRDKDQLRVWESNALSELSAISRQNYQDKGELSQVFLSRTIELLEMHFGVIYILEIDSEGNEVLVRSGSYGIPYKLSSEGFTIQPNQGITGSAYKNDTGAKTHEIPDTYVPIESGLGESTPTLLITCPIRFNEQNMGVIELSGFNEWNEIKSNFLERAMETLGAVIFSLQIQHDSSVQQSA